MDTRMALRYELEKNIAETGCTLSRLAEFGGPSIGNLSVHDYEAKHFDLLLSNNWMH